MSSRDREIVDDMRQVFRSMLSSPSIREVAGTWWLVETGEYRECFILDEQGVQELRRKGSIVTPVMVHTVISTR